MCALFPSSLSLSSPTPSPSLPLSLSLSDSLPGPAGEANAVANAEQVPPVPSKKHTTAASTAIVVRCAANSPFLREKEKKMGQSGNRTRDLSHPKRESCL